MKSKVAVVRTSVGTVFEDVRRTLELGGVGQALDPRATTILKDNISWHFPFPGANTTPWQLEGTIRALRHAGFDDQVCVQNKTVVTDAFKGEDLNHYLPIFRHYERAGALQLQGRGHDVGAPRPPGEDAGARTRSSPRAFTSRTSSSARTSSTCRR